MKHFHLGFYLLFLSASAFAAGGSAPKLPDPEPPTSGNPGSPAPVSAISDITSIADKSLCKNYSWKNRGKAPLAYIEGMAVTFAKSLCRQRTGQSSGTLMAQKNTQNKDRDALAWYESEFDNASLSIDSSGSETLRSLFTLGIGLGMRESSGKYCTGWDTSASNQSASTAEAGMFQSSYNSMGASSELKKIYDEYKKDPSRCQLSVFQKNVKCSAQSIVGSGAGADFQRMLKSCPALAAEYAMITLRTLRKHYGPIVRKEAEINLSCNSMLDEVQSYVERNQANVCGQL